MTDHDEFTISLDRIMTRLAKDVEAGLFDEKATEKVSAIKTLAAYEMQRFRKSKGGKGGSALSKYRLQIDGPEPEKEIKYGHASN